MRPVRERRGAWGEGEGEKKEPVVVRTLPGQDNALSVGATCRRDEGERLRRWLIQQVMRDKVCETVVLGRGWMLATS